MILAYYDHKIFHLASLAMLDPIKVIDVEFLQYLEMDVETGSFNMGQKEIRKKQRAFMLGKLDRWFVFCPLAQSGINSGAIGGHCNKPDPLSTGFNEHGEILN